MAMPWASRCLFLSWEVIIALIQFEDENYLILINDEKKNVLSSRKRLASKNYVKSLNDTLRIHDWLLSCANVCPEKSTNQHKCLCLSFVSFTKMLTTAFFPSKISLFCSSLAIFACKHRKKMVSKCATFSFRTKFSFWPTHTNNVFRA